MKKGIFTYRNDITLDEQYKLIKKAGFDSVMIWWGEEKDDYINLSNKYNIEICNAHLPFEDIRKLWVPDTGGDDYAMWLCKQVESLGNSGIKIAVMHTSRGTDTYPCNVKGLERIKRIVETAEKSNVKIAFENLRVINYLDYIFENIKSDNICFCYDSGHHNYMSPERDLLAGFGDKLIALHLNDNMGDSDDHMLPYDGTSDWEQITDMLVSLRYDGVISLEVQQDRHVKYSNMEPYEFFCAAFEKASKIEMELLRKSK